MSFYSIEKIFNQLPVKKKQHVIEKFLSKIIVNNNDCWGWNSCFKQNGYALLTLGRGLPQLLASRFSYWYFNMVDPAKYCVCHTCDNPSCVNPNHLFLGTNKDNTQDMMRKRRNCPPPTSFGEDHHNTKLKIVDITKIKKDVRIARHIAKDYGISIKTVYRIKKGQTWKKYDEELNI